MNTTQKIILETLTKMIEDLKRLKESGLVDNPTLADFTRQQRRDIYKIFKAHASGEMDFHCLESGDLLVAAIFKAHEPSDWGCPDEFMVFLELPRYARDYRDNIEGLETLLAELSATETKYINLTPHTVNIIGNDDTVIMSLPSAGSARATQTAKVVDTLSGVDVHKTAYTGVEGLPDPQPNTYYVVSLLVLQALAGARRDCVAPNTSPTPTGVVRGDDGQIIGVRSFTVI